MTKTASVIVAPQDRSVAVPDAPRLSERSRAYAQEARAKNTRRAYRFAWECFAAWCDAKGIPPLPASPATVADYLTECADGKDGKPGLRVASLRLRLVAIATAHRLHNPPLRLDTAAPEIAEIMRGISRTHGTAAAKKTRPPPTSFGTRFGPWRRATASARCATGPCCWSASPRRSAGRNWWRWTWRTSRSAATASPCGCGAGRPDQLGEGTEIGVPFGSAELTCPVLALRAWLAASGITEGPVFRPVNKAGRPGSARLTDQSVALAVKAALEAAGHDAAEFSGHSLRSGFATSAARAGVPEAAIQRQTGHKSLPVLRSYIRRGGLFTDNTAAKVGL